MARIQRGFSLIELMIVIAIIGILVAIGLPQYQNYTARAQVIEAATLAGGLKSQIAAVAQEIGGLNGINSATFDLPAANAVTGRYVSSVGVANGVITATMRAANTNNTSKLVGGLTLVMTPTLNAGSVDWACGGTIPAQFRRC